MSSALSTELLPAEAILGDDTMGGLPVVRHEFGSRAAGAVLLAFLLFVILGVAVHFRNGGLPASFASQDPDLPIFLVDETTSAGEKLDRLQDEAASTGSALLRSTVKDRLQRGLIAFARGFARPFAEARAPAVVALGRESASVVGAIGQAAAHERVRRDHLRAEQGEERDISAFLMLYRKDPWAIAEGYVSSVEAMEAAANAGRPASMAGKTAVDAAFAQVQPGDWNAVRSFISTYRTNAYALSRGYLAQAQSMLAEADRIIDAREEQERKRQKSTEWVWD